MLSFINLFSINVCFQIVDLSLLVKQEMTVKTNPISHVISASYIHYNTHTEVNSHMDKHGTDFLTFTCLQQNYRHF